MLHDLAARPLPELCDTSSSAWSTTAPTTSHWLPSACTARTGFDPTEAPRASDVRHTTARAGMRRLVHHSVLRPRTRAKPHHTAEGRVEESLDAVVAGTGNRCQAPLRRTSSSGDRVVRY
ncbi:hypothetical protein LY71_11013 [Geodermatophilus tzadiensis]|uniref:Uncharacterized protein n=1 Tax=Geodermatophilus tzadiensis TaxID=1137988 RepID=A0A2T0TR50_9ACTN|nr:hypothetical protein LY71_11013 [Geodermatophilus tzadiensis]